MTAAPNGATKGGKSPFLFMGLGCLALGVLGIIGVVVLVVVVALASAGHQPELQQISYRTDFPLFGDPAVYETFRNKGGKGTSLVEIEQTGRQWKRIAYYDGAEQREIKITAPGLQNGSFSVGSKPTSSCSEEELKGVSQAE